RGTVGLLGSVGQLLKFQHAGKTGDSIRMTLATNTGLLDLGVLNGVSVVFYESGKAVGTYALNDALLHLRLLDGVNKSYATIVAPVDYDAMEIRLGGVATALTSIDVYYVQQLYPMPAIVSDTATICYGDSTSFTATPAPNTIVGWYASSTGGTVLSTNSIFTTPALTQSMTYYVTAARVTGADTCWDSNRMPVVVKVNPRARAVDIEVSGADTICTGEMATLQASSKTVADSIFSWYSDATLKSKLFTGSIFKVSPTATTTYYVTVEGTGFCENAPDSGRAVTITVNPRADSMDITVKGDTVCSGEQATLQASSTVVPNGIFTWYSDPKLTNKLYTGASYTISPTNVTTYYVTVQGNGFCENAPDSAKSVTVVVNPRAKAGDINMSGPDTICAGEQATLQAGSTVVPNPIFNWYSDAKLTNKLYTGASYAVTPSGTTTYYVTVLGTGFCENEPDSGKSVTIVVNPRAQAGDIEVSGGSTICEGDTVTLAASSKTLSNAIFTWYSDSQLKNKLATGTTFKVIPDVTTAYYVTAQGSGFCENAHGDAQIVTVTVNPVPKTPVVSGPAGAICANTTATLEITNAQAGVTYNWYSVATGGTALATGTTYTTAALQAATTYYVAGAVTGGCAGTSSRTSVTVTVSQVPEPPKVQAADVTVCIGSRATFEVASPQTGITYNWYTTPTGGTPLTSGTTFTTSPLQSDSTYYVEADAGGGCPSTSRTQVNAKVVGLPPAPTVNLSANPVCPDSTVTLTASSGAQGVTYKWYDSPTGGNLLFTGNPYTTQPLTATTTYYVETVNAGGCANTGGRASVTVVVLMQLPTPQVIVDTATINSITFAWEPVPGAVGYQVSTDNGTTWQQPSSGATGLTHTVTGLQLNQSVTIIVKALAQSSCQNSQPSQAVTGTTKGSPLGDYIFVPNAFSPNGDGLNDVWQVYGNNISKLQVMVYNQYGQKIFESHSQQDGWDGTYQGKKQPVGVYVYYLQITFTDGKTETKKGDINLIR
ncbi:MAG: T9SS type B sorting domain-containing protein, partial [Chitinophagaceae bacterium]